SAVGVGATVFDTATLSSASPDAGGTVTYAVYTDNTCTTSADTPPAPATVTVTNGAVPASGPVTFPVVGKFWFQATYSGDANNLVPVGGLKSACASEPVAVVDANIQITPQTATNPVGTNHVLTGHVNVIGSNGASVP